MLPFRSVPIRKLPTCLTIPEQSSMQSSCPSGVSLPTPPRLFSTAVTFLEYWKRKNASLAHQWDCMGFQEEDEKPRPEFAANAPYLEENPITGVSFVVIVLVDFGSGARAFLPQRSEVATNRSWKWSYPSHGNLMPA